MLRAAMESEPIASMGYRAERCELDIEFRQSGDVYRYFGVSAEEYAEFMVTESKGTYLNRVFKAKEHPYKLLKRGRK